MYLSVVEEPFCWSLEYARQHPFKTSGIAALLAGRYLFGAVFVYGAYHKLKHNWVHSPILREYFLTRLTDIDPQSFQARYLRRVAIPHYRSIAWFLVLGQCSISTSMLLGLAVRPHAALSLFMLLNFVAGSYADASMPPLIVYAALLMMCPSGHWLGLDEALHRRYPHSIWFR